MIGAGLVGVVGGDCMCEDGVVVECVDGESSLKVVCLKKRPKKNKLGFDKDCALLRKKPQYALQQKT